ncbi:hypothetical protein BKA62DRAFT_777202 [Auriculariales sp. MPI-PUGE-AT-0066]|nr:hypothetical protein BKA62DRAFT_777202 [Auriculariales sp. MPI-PUGE-AT-0066]
MTPFVQTYAERSITLADFEIELMSTDYIADGAYSRNCKGQLKRGLQLTCTLHADLSGVIPHLRQHRAASKITFWRLDFSIETFFGQTSLCAALVWNEQGIVRRGPVAIVPNSVV